MRMRKKKNIEEKIDNLSSYIYTLRSDDLNFNTAVEKKEYLNLDEIFKKQNIDDNQNSPLATKLNLDIGCGEPNAPAGSRNGFSDNQNSPLATKLNLDIGCGKGTFLCEMAKRHPDERFIGIEAERNVAYMAGKKIKEENINNAVVFNTLAQYLPKYIPDNSISEIYLNFSCPYPKSDYESHRLTSKMFLKIYDDFSTDDGRIFLKTDNRKFFEYSLESLSKYGYVLENISLDLHADDDGDNIVTEYEQKFIDLGQKIYSLQASLKGK